MTTRLSTAVAGLDTGVGRVNPGVCGAAGPPDAPGSDWTPAVPDPPREGETPPNEESSVDYSVRDSKQASRAPTRVAP